MEDLTNKQVLMCVAPGDNPNVQWTKGTEFNYVCHICATQVGVGPAGQELLAERADVMVTVCTSCMANHVPSTANQVEILPSIVKEVAEELNISEEEAEKIIRKNGGAEGTVEKFIDSLRESGLVKDNEFN